MNPRNALGNIRHCNCLWFRGEISVQIPFTEFDIFCVDKKNQLDVTFCIIFFSSNSCSTCFGQPYAHHQELTTA